MKRYIQYALFLIIITNISFGCSTATIEKNNSISFSDIPTGQVAISQDKTENIFNRIELKDIQLQLKKDTISQLENARKLYRNALNKSVMEFTEKDKRRLNKIFNEVEKTIKEINPKILPKNIQLIKVKPHLYGESVFYTRDNSIIIPSDMLEEFDYDIVKHIIIHEIFHIYSRNKMNTKREELYGLIHFGKIRKKLIIPEIIKNKILLNPDGLEMDWYIESQIESSTQRLIPLLIAIENDDSNFYFDNLELRFYPIFEEGENVKIKEGHYYEESELTDFYEQITDNTTYIIHPDEILADNFVLVVLSQDKPAILKGLSKEGRELVGNLLHLLEKDD